MLQLESLIIVWYHFFNSIFALELYLNDICLLFNIIILYSSAPSSTTCLKARSDGAPDNTAVLQAGSPKIKENEIDYMDKRYCSK